MYLVLLGVVLLIMKSVGYGPVADWPWWGVMSPFGVAVIWWAIADKSGLTARKVMERENQRKEDRIERNRAATGLSKRKK